MDYLEKVNEHTQHALKVLKKIDNEKKFSEFARDKFNEVGLSGTSTKAEEMLDELYDIGCGIEEITDAKGEKKLVKKHETEHRLKAIRTMADMVGGSLNEKSTTNVQNNQFNFGEFLEKLK